MTDFPQPGMLPLFVHTYTRWGPVRDLQGGSINQPTTFNWVANQAVYMPVAIPWPYPVNRVFWVNGSTITTSNVDFGIYTPSGSRIYSTGSTALTATGAPQFVTPATPFVLPAGSYYFAYVCDTAISRSFGTNIGTAANGALAGMLSQATALPLPATATFATYVTPGLELCGITRTPSGF